MLDTLTSGAAQGLIWGLLALGFYIAFRILDFADMTCEGSITLGASVAALCLYKGVNPFLSLPIVFLSGCLAGMITGLLHTKLKIPPILSGILTMSALYSINIKVMSMATGQQSIANLQLKGADTVFSFIKQLIPVPKTYVTLIFGALVALLVMAALYWFFGTELGCAIRATGANEKMCRAQGINTDTTKIVGLALANGIIALSGSLLCMYQGYSDVKLGVGSIVIALASIIIGEALFARVRNFFFRLLGVIVGSVIYRVIVALVIYLGMPSEDLKLMTSIVVVLALAFTTYKSTIIKSFKGLLPKKKEGA